MSVYVFLKNSVKRLLSKFCRALAPCILPFKVMKVSMDPETAYDILNKIHPEPPFRVEADNHLLKDVDLQIIVPVYNVEAFVGRCMDSILCSCENQNKFSYRIDVINDGSTDGSAQVLEHYAENPHIHIITKANGGLSSARNEALKTLHGKYIMFVDSDDQITENAVYKLMKEAVLHDADIVEGSLETVDEVGRLIGIDRHVAGRSCDTGEVIFGYACCKVIRAERFEKVKFPEGYWYEDSIIGGIIQANTIDLFTIPDVVYRYTLNYKGITQSSRGKLRAIETYYIIHNVWNYMIEHGVTIDERMKKRMLQNIATNFDRTQGLKVEENELLIAGFTIMRLDYLRAMKYAHLDSLTMSASFRERVLEKAIFHSDFGQYCFISKYWKWLSP